MKKKNELWGIGGILLIINGFGICLYQIYYWLKYAEWNSFSLLFPLSYISEIREWVSYPYEWVGVHKILDFLPLSITLLMVGFLFIISFNNQ